MWGRLNEQSSACTKRASTKMRHVGMLMNSHPCFTWEKWLPQLTSLLSHWETARGEDWGIVTVAVDELAWAVKQSQKLGMSCQGTDNETDSVEILRRDARVDTGREAGEKQKLS